MDIKPIIEAKDIKKRYRLGVIGTGTLSNDLKSWWARKTHKEDPNAKLSEERFSGEDFWALNGVTFNIMPCESVGIIGANGAGKSTLLKILSRITSPTEGEAILRGRVTSMLEVGTGFNGELTGRENIYLNGAILGMSKNEIESKMEEIIDFSECREFIDTPVKRYSSGMYVKLAFSVAAHLESEIMIMDEVLAVGDVAFQKKCINKMMEEIHSHKKTILYVSHNMATVEALCSRCIVLKAGKVIFDGATEDAISIYSGTQKDAFIKRKFSENDMTSYGVYVRDIELQEKSDFDFNAGEQIKLKMHWGSNFAKEDIVLGAIICKGTVPIKTSLSKPFTVCENTDYESILEIDTNDLPEGKYEVKLSFCKYITPEVQSFYTQSDLFIFNILKNSNQEDASWHSDIWGHTVGKNLPLSTKILEKGKQ